jgi:hypothetical protein
VNSTPLARELDFACGGMPRCTVHTAFTESEAHPRIAPLSHGSPVFKDKAAKRESRELPRTPPLSHGSSILNTKQTFREGFLSRNVHHAQAATLPRARRFATPTRELHFALPRPARACS